MDKVFRNKNVGVIGAGRSGINAALALAQRGARVLLSDSRAVAALTQSEREQLGDAGIWMWEGATVETAIPPDCKLIVTSPGVPRTAQVLQNAVQQGIPVWSEIELAYRITSAQFAAVTGTNGKTTTTLLLAHMLERAGLQPVVGGNVSADTLKRTLTEAAEQANKKISEEGGKSLIVAEISSFQLEWIEKFAPRVAILTNITPDHLNRYATFEEYADSKARIFAAQTQSDWAVVNYDNPESRKIGQSGLKAKRCWFTRQEQLPDDSPAAFLFQDVLTVRLVPGQSPIALLAASELPETLPGVHSIENALAAGAAALALGADPEAVAEALLDFPGVAHRMELVGERNGVRYINNSMCTNIAAGIASLESLKSSAIVIAGGADKELEFEPLTPSLKRHARAVILIGTAADKMEKAFRAGGYESIFRADSLEEATVLAAKTATSGEIVMLSPVCASFDMFSDFEARGQAFRDAVHRLMEVS